MPRFSFWLLASGHMNDLLQRFFSGDTRALARIITKVENRSEDCLEILQSLFPKTGRSRIIGVTGSPGSGKSTLVDKLAVLYRKTGHTLGVVAVDPSSPFTGGAILGDRIRMQTLGADPGVYIRSMATRGYLGGLAATTSDVVTVLDAAKKDPIIVETVGVGQDEIDIVKLADLSVVVLVPGMGDDVQALKAGIMEIGDIFVINKCDRPGVEKMERSLKTMLSLAPPADGWNPPIVKTVATKSEGIEELQKTIDECHASLRNMPARAEQKRSAIRERLIRLLEQRLLESVIEEAFPDGELNRVVDEIARRERDPYSVVEQVLQSSRFQRFKP